MSGILFAKNDSNTNNSLQTTESKNQTINIWANSVYQLSVQYWMYSSSTAPTESKIFTHWTGETVNFKIYVAKDAISKIIFKIRETNRNWKTVTFNNHDANFWNTYNWASEAGKAPTIFWLGTIFNPHVNMWSGTSGINTPSGMEVGHWY